MYGYTVFHEKIMKTLIDGVHKGSCSHAYIFDGRKGLNKHEAAELFAKALTCRNTALAPCGECPSCIEARADTNPDIIHIERESSGGKKKKYLGIEPVRSAVENSQIKPFSSPKKVYIIDEGELMNTEAQNAFLKTLEEPPEYVVIIIVTDNAQALLPTVLSRAELIHFPPVSGRIVGDYLRRKYPDRKDDISFYINYCEGIPGDADKIMGDDRFDELRRRSLEMLTPLLSSNRAEAFEVQKFVSDNSDDVDVIFDLWLSFLRDIMVIKCSAFDNIVNTDKTQMLRTMSARYDMELIAYAIDMAVETRNMLSRSVKLSAAVLRYALLLKENRK